MPAGKNQESALRREEANVVTEIKYKRWKGVGRQKMEAANTKKPR